MIKIISAALIVLSCSVMGMSINRGMYTRRKALKAHISALQLIKSEILFKNSPLPYMIFLIQQSCGPEAAGFYRAALDCARSGMTFSSAAGRACGILRKSGLSKQDAEIIRDTCSVLGQADGATQVEEINRAASLLGKQLELLKEEIASRGGLYRAIGATAGIILALMAI